MQSAMECATDQTDHKMGSNDAKNDVKTLFFIANTLHGLLAGLFPLVVAIASLLGRNPEKEFLIFGVMIGLPTLVFTAVGYHGAIMGSKKILYIYCSLMGTTAAAYVAAAVTFNVLPELGEICFVDTGITMAAVALSLILAKHGGPNAVPLRFFCLLIGLAVFVVLVVAYIFNYFL